MALPQRKQNFIEGAAVLTLAVAVTKVIGAVYKIPLGNLLDKDGMAHFYVAYNIYSLLLIVSTPVTERTKSEGVKSPATSRSCCAV